MSEALLSLDEGIETIYIVGGFGGCQYIYNAITEEFGNSYKLSVRIYSQHLWRKVTLFQ